MTMPAMACAALPSTSRETMFKPATSTTDGISTISQQPTYWAVLPLATVDTNSFGKPIGGADALGHESGFAALRVHRGNHEDGRHHSPRQQIRSLFLRGRRYSRSGAKRARRT